MIDEKELNDLVEHMVQQRLEEQERKMNEWIEKIIKEKPPNGEILTIFFEIIVLPHANAPLYQFMNLYNATDENYLYYHCTL